MCMFQKMAIAKPQFHDSQYESFNFLMPCFADWINHPEKPLLHVHSPGCELQVIDITYCMILNMFSITVSDGVHVLVAKLDRLLNWKINQKEIQIFDIIIVKEATGHPANFSFGLVGYLICLKPFSSCLTFNLGGYSMPNE